MKKQTLLYKAGTQAGIVFLFIVAAYVYLFPLLEGKVLSQPDIQSHAGIAKELIDYRNATGEEALWTNSIFGGMPGYMISVLYHSNLLRIIHGWFTALFHPAAMIILYLIGFYILLISLKTDRWLSAAGAFAYGFSTYLMTIIVAGHNTKAYALGYLMIVIAGILMAYRTDRWKGAMILAAGLAFEIQAGHPQITYYGLLAMVVFGITDFIYAIREKRIPGFLKTTGMLAVAALLAVAVNFSYLYTNYKYAKETIRGKSELTLNSDNQTTGLDKDYVVQWSEGIPETLTLLIPNFMGGSHFTYPDVNSESYKTLRTNGVENPRKILSQIIMYHGDKPVTSGPYYAGAIIIFLFVLGLFVVKGADRWWLLAATVMSLVLSWGKYVMPLTSFLLDYLPMYNKFRAPEMTLVIAGFTMPLLGFLGLRQILTGKVEKRELLNGLKWAFGITGGVTLLFTILPGIAGDFAAPFDSSYPDWLRPSVIADRQDMLRGDAFRSFIFIALAAAGLLAWHLKKLKTGYLVGALALLILADLWMVDKRYLNKNNFFSKREIQNGDVPAVVDKEILKDKTLSYRVLPLQNPWQDARASSFHKNVGGYHAAKLRRYQEMIDHHFSPEIDKMIDGLRNQTSSDSLFGSLTAINMLNTKYFIYDLNSAPLINPDPWGNAWFASGFKIVANADEEIAALGSITSKSQVVIDKRFASSVEGKNFTADTAGSIILTDYKPNALKYKFKAGSDQLTVFSEIYYADGWKAFIDGKETPVFRVNYILRAMVIPAGEHTVEFSFHPASWSLGNKISYAGSILLFLTVAGYFILEWKKRKKIL